MKTLRVLVIDDCAADAELLLRRLRDAGYEIAAERVDEAPRLREALKHPWDVILCDHSMPRLTVAEALEAVREAGVGAPLLLVSGVIGEEAAADSIRLGAHDFVLKDRLGRLVPAVERALCDVATQAELHASQEALARTEKLRMLGQMSVGISHDLKNILNPLSLYLQIIERAWQRDDRRAGQEAIEAMKGVLKQGLETIDRLRTFSRQGDGLPLTRASLADVAHEAIKLARPRAQGGPRPPTLREEYAPAPEVFVRAPEVVAAVLNLIVNALDAGAGRGVAVTVRTGPLRGGAFVQVEDDGPGMAPEVQRRIFEPFFTTKGTEGTGLGLAMVDACISSHGGQISLETAPGEGARFTLWLPPAPPDEAR